MNILGHRYEKITKYKIQVDYTGKPVPEHKISACYTNNIGGNNLICVTHINIYVRVVIF